MLTITKIQGDYVGNEACDKLVQLAYMRAKQERVGIASSVVLDNKLYEALSYVFALGSWGFEGDFYVEGTESNCITPSMVNSILSKIREL